MQTFTDPDSTARETFSNMGLNKNTSTLVRVTRFEFMEKLYGS